MVRSILAARARSVGLDGPAVFELGRTELDQIKEESAERGRRRRDEPNDTARVALGFEESLTQVDEMTLGLLLAAAPAIGVRHAHPGKRIFAGDDHVTRDEVAVLEREDVERSLELVPREDERDCQPPALPRRGRAVRRARGLRTSHVR